MVEELRIAYTNDYSANTCGPAVVYNEREYSLTDKPEVYFPETKALKKPVKNIPKLGKQTVLEKFLEEFPEACSINECENDVLEVVVKDGISARTAEEIGTTVRTIKPDYGPKIINLTLPNGTHFNSFLPANDFNSKPQASAFWR